MRAMNILTIDTGTTNSRCYLWREGALLGQAGVEVGVRDSAISGSKDALKHAVRDIIKLALAQAGLEPGDVGLVLASGMITSNLGLVEVPHLVAPVGLDELARGMVRMEMPEVFAQPIWFIPGVRNQSHKVTLLNHEAMDMMRGEETETIGLLQRLELSGHALLVLPGSHTKLVSVDQAQRITGCATTLSGELLQAITQHTLISQALGAEFARELRPEMLLAGAASAQRTGLARACFSVRTLAQFTDLQHDDRASFLLGAVLSDDVLALKNSSAIQMRPDTTIVICGKPMLRDALALLIAENGFFYGRRIVATDAQQAGLSGVGAIAVAAARGLLAQAAPQPA